jgi:hypothetical protein
MCRGGASAAEAPARAATTTEPLSTARVAKTTLAVRWARWSMAGCRYVTAVCWYNGRDPIPRLADPADQLTGPTPVRAGTGSPAVVTAVFHLAGPPAR